MVGGRRTGVLGSDREDRQRDACPALNSGRSPGGAHTLIVPSTPAAVKPPFANQVVLDLTWEATSAAAHDTTRSHVREPRGGIIRSAANNWMADAIAYGSVTLDGVNLAPAPTFDAHLQRVKQSCSVIQHPRGGADFDCS